MKFESAACFVFFSIFVSSAYASSGRITLRENIYLNQQPSPVPQSDSEVILQYESKTPLSNNWLFQFQPDVRMFEAPQPNTFAADFNGRNTYLKARTNDLYLEFGSFIKEWEGTDGINPMDIATIKTYRDPINAESLGSWGIAAKSRGSSAWSWEVFYVPWQTPAIMPLSYSGWWPRNTASLPLTQNNVTALLPGEINYGIHSPQILNHADENNIGARLQFHGYSWDAALAGFQGQSQIPFFRPTLQGSVVETSPIQVIQLTNPVNMQPVEYLRRTVSALFDYNLNPWIFRISGRYDQPIGADPLMPGWSEQFVGGVERTVTISDKTVIFSLQYAAGVMPSYPESFLNLSDPFQNALTWGIRYPLSDNLLLVYSGLNDFQYHSYYDSLKLEDSIGEHLAVSLVAELIGGAPDSLFGMWQNQSCGYLTATYGF